MDSSSRDSKTRSYTYIYMDTPPPMTYSLCIHMCIYIYIFKYMCVYIWCIIVDLINFVKPSRIEVSDRTLTPALPSCSGCLLVAAEWTAFGGTEDAPNAVSSFNCTADKSDQ